MRVPPSAPISFVWSSRPTEGDRIVKTMRTKGIGYADRVNVEAIQVTVTVSDDKGRFVGGIPRNAFRVYEDGKSEPITYFASEDVPSNSSSRVDISGNATPRCRSRKPQ